LNLGVPTGCKVGFISVVIRIIPLD
jgi:hypothetical protein